MNASLVARCSTVVTTAASATASSTRRRSAAVSSSSRGGAAPTVVAAAVGNNKPMMISPLVQVRKQRNWHPISQLAGACERDCLSHASQRRARMLQRVQKKGCRDSCALLLFFWRFRRKRRIRKRPPLSLTLAPLLPPRSHFKPIHSAAEQRALAPAERKRRLLFSARPPRQRLRPTQPSRSRPFRLPHSTPPLQLTAPAPPRTCACSWWAPRVTSASLSSRSSSREGLTSLRSPERNRASAGKQTPTRRERSLRAPTFALET